MRVNGHDYRTIWMNGDGSVEVIDQTRLPHDFSTVRLTRLDDVAAAIRAMVVRGAPLIGATAAYGMALALREDPADATLREAARTLLATRPTAVNLRWAVARVTAEIAPLPCARRAEAAERVAAAICDEDVRCNRAIGEHGLAILEALHRKESRRPVNVLTHCNAGWLATVDWGTALAPIFLAHERGVPVHAWVDETRPRLQGALTAWELRQAGVPHTVVVDNAGGLLMQRGLVDCCIVGSDRTTARGDVCNKIGTYLKALAAQANDVPFYVALPESTIDWSIDDGLVIPIERRCEREVTHVSGLAEEGGVIEVRVIAEGSAVANDAFDVTPAALVSGLITNRGVCPATREGLAALFPVHDRALTVTEVPGT